jgi:hypothetical protein
MEKKWRGYIKNTAGASGVELHPSDCLFLSMQEVLPEK